MIPACLLALLFLGSAAVAQNDPIIRLDNPAAVAQTLRNEGFRAKLTTDDRGQPVIDTGIGGILFFIYFFGCERGGECRSLLMSASFKSDNGVSLERINDWNADALLGRAFLDDVCDPVIDHFLIAYQGRLEADFVDELENWGDVITRFRDFVFDDEDSKAVVATCGGDDAI